MVNLQRFTIGIPYTTQFQHMRCVSHLIVQHAPCAQTTTFNEILFRESEILFRESEILFREILFRESEILFRESDILFRESEILFRESEILLIIFRKSEIIFRESEIISRESEIIPRKSEIKIIHTKWEPPYKATLIQTLHIMDGLSNVIKSRY